MSSADHRQTIRRGSGSSPIDCTFGRGQGFCDLRSDAMVPHSGTATEQERVTDEIAPGLCKRLTDPVATHLGTDECVDAEDTFELGVRLTTEDRLAEAEDAFARADGCGHAAAAFNLGVLLAYRGDVAGAEVAYQRADERGVPDAAFELAMLLLGQDRLDEAERAFERADEHGHARAAAKLGALLEERGDSPRRSRVFPAPMSGAMPMAHSRLPCCSSSTTICLKPRRRSRARRSADTQISAQPRRGSRIPPEHQRGSNAPGRRRPTPNDAGHAVTDVLASVAVGAEEPAERPRARALTAKRRRKLAAGVVLAIGIALAIAIATANGSKIRNLSPHRRRRRLKKLRPPRPTKLRRARDRRRRSLTRSRHPATRNPGQGAEQGEGPK